MRKQKDPFEGCVLHEMAKRGERMDYSYPQNGLPKLTIKSAPAWSAALAGAGLDGRLRMPDKATMENSNKKDPFAGCVLHEMAKRGERMDYSYPQNGLPKLTVKSAPAWSAALALLSASGRDKKRVQKRK